MEIDELLELTKNVLCATNLELICRCASCGNCGGCKVMKVANLWTKAFGPRLCKHPLTFPVGNPENPVQRCHECRSILKNGESND